jgi:uncharacterized protein
VDRETCETAGDMEANLPARRAFPYADWGPLAALLGVVLAFGIQLLMAIPVVLVSHPVHGEFGDAANIVLQLVTAVSFLAAPLVIAMRRGASPREAISRLGVRRFRPSALKWMAAAIGFYLLCTVVYTVLVGQPHQKDIAKGFGPVPFQVLLIVVAAPISEELCFRGMLFGGLRARLPRLAAALVSGAIFGGLHATTGVSAIPPLIAFGFVLALLYEKTGSIIPGILLHMLNNSVALLGQ